MTIQELIRLIEQWAIDRGLDKNGTVEGQLIKTAEEVAELIIGISKDDVDVIKDSIGDVFVTLVVGNLIDNQLNIVNLCNHALENKWIYSSKFDAVADLIDALKDFFKDEGLDGYTPFVVHGMFYTLISICLSYNLDFIDCVESAYKEIADRKGVVRDGTFIKEDDLI